MKLGIIIPDGAADVPIAALGGKTPLEAANTPHLDRAAAMGRQGTVRTTPQGFQTGSDVCSMSLLGYDPAQYHTGRAPIEAAASGFAGGPGDVICRMNLVTIEDGVLKDHSAAGIDTSAARELFAAVEQAWRDADLFDGCEILPGVAYRCSLVDSSGTDYSAVHTTPPHEILDTPAEPYLPRGGPAAERLNAFMRVAEERLSSHPMNASRVGDGKLPATHVWIWGHGVYPQLPGFEQRFGLRGAMTTAVDLLAGIASLIGWDRLDVPGLSGWHDNDYAGQGNASAAAIDRFDIVCCHVESPDEAAHRADPVTKTAAIEAIDRHCVGPMLDRLMCEESWRLLVVPDHYTLCGTRMHDPTSPPFLIAGSGVEADESVRFTETHAEAGGPHILHGHELISTVLVG
ncbi:MAG: 2,3-bisphosphoglycerate-independent phosphoglycerate mutase [Planctomycetota bacterium]